MVKVIIIGSSGMLGNSILKNLTKYPGVYDVYGIQRSASDRGNIFDSVDILHDKKTLFDILDKIKPEFVINCIGVIKQVKSANNREALACVNSLFPHQLCNKTEEVGAKLIHFSTDCVFSGRTGSYEESSTPDASDLYGQSKHLGEVVDREKALTLRTSIIGHGLNPNNSLVDWFLSQKGGEVSGFRNAYFSGLTCHEIGNFIHGYLSSSKSISGLYHLSSDKIDKYTLLSIIKSVYQLDIELLENHSFRIDRSLNSERIRKELNYIPPKWEKMVEEMYLNEYRGNNVQK